MDAIPDTDELTEESLEQLVVYTRYGYEWAFTLTESATGDTCLVSGRSITPEKLDDGSTELIVSVSNHYYGCRATRMINDADETLGYAETMEQAQELVRKHKSTDS